MLRLDKDFAMPPKENDKLSAEQVEWIRDWIKRGTLWPDYGSLLSRAHVR